MSGIRCAAALCLLGAIFVGCSTQIRPQTGEARRETAPSVASIDEFLDLIDFNDLLNRLVTRKDAIGADIAHDGQIQLASMFHVFSEAAQSHEMSQFYGNDIDDDFTVRLPIARSIYNREVEPLETEIQAHIRELVADYSAKWKSLSSPTTIPAQ
jgi:hypothetical protein